MAIETPRNDQVPSRESSYRFSSDGEPQERELAALMHEVAIDAQQRASVARRILQKQLERQTSEALTREGY